MKYRLLGNSGLRVSEAALGTATFGEEWGWGSVKDEARQVYAAFREAGANFIDTANSYTQGTSESFLGEFMKGHRQSMVLATKYSTAARGWMTWFARARCSTSEFLMPLPGGSPRRIHLPYCADGLPLQACRSNTA